MSKFSITVRNRDLTVEEAVQEATYPQNTDGVFERMRETIELQNKLIANLLKVQFGLYGDDFSSSDNHPSTNAEKLEFVFSGSYPNIRVREE